MEAHIPEFSRLCVHACQCMKHVCPSPVCAALADPPCTPPTCRDQEPEATGQGLPLPGRALAGSLCSALPGGWGCRLRCQVVVLEPVPPPWFRGQGPQLLSVEAAALGVGGHPWALPRVHAPW